MESNLLALAWSQLWQVTLLVVAMAIVVRLVARNRPHLAYALWLVMLVKCVTPPVWSSPSGVFCWLQPSRGATVSQVSVHVGTHDSQWFDVEHAKALSPAGAIEVGLPERSLTVEVQEASDWPGRLLLFGLMTWMAGAAFSLILSARQWQRCLRVACRHGSEPTRELGELILALAGRLGLRRSPRVIITHGKLGPAVTGILRPALLLPEGILRNENAQNIEPSLAHELIHIRRGDLWAGVLQTLVLALWWFHPLVRWAVRQAMCEAERCCDEAVLAELECRPKVYARGLLSVLQYKTDWVPATAFPGAGRVEATATRLERIMRLGQGCRRRSPWWCWLVMLSVAAAVLPGGAFLVAGQEQGDRDLSNAALPPEKPDATVGGDHNAPPSNPATATSEVAHAYPVGDIIAETSERYDIDPIRVKDKLLQRIEMIASAPEQHSGKSAPTVAWSGDQLVVRATGAVQKEVAQTLESVRKFGLAELKVHISFATIPSEGVDRLGIGWTLMPSETSGQGDPMDPMRPAIIASEEVDRLGIGWLSGEQGDPSEAKGQRVSPNTAVQVAGLLPDSMKRPVLDKDSARQGCARHVIAEHWPMRYAVLDEKGADAFLEMAQSSRQSNVMQAPKITLFNGQSAFVSDCSESPFVVGVKPVKGPYATAMQPVVRIVQEGTRVWVRPVLGDDDSLSLDYDVDFANIVGVEACSFKVAGTEQTTTIQIPTVESTRIQATSEMSLNSTLVIVGQQQYRHAVEKDQSRSIFTRLADGILESGRNRGDIEKMTLLVLVRVEKAFPKPDGPSGTEQVGMLSR